MVIRKRRGFFVLASLLAIVLVAVFWISRPGDRSVTSPPDPGPFPIERIEGAPDFSDTTYNPLHPVPVVTIDTISGDGKWVAFRIRGAAPPYYFFDVGQRQFVGRIARPPAVWSYQWWPVFGHYWTPDHLVMEQSRPRKTRYDNLIQRLPQNIVNMRADSFFYEVNCFDRKMRFLCGHEADVMQDSGALGGSPNRTRSAIVLSLSLFFPALRKQEFIVWDLHTGSQRVLSASSFKGARGSWASPWGWLPDDHTAVFRSYRGWPTTEGFYLLDISEKKRPRRIPVLERFERLRDQGKIQPDEGEITLINLLRFSNDGRRARLAVSFKSNEMPSDLSASRSSIWDLDIETGQLARVTDLRWGMALYGSVVCSPSGDKFIAAPTSTTVVTGDPSSPTTPVLYEIGQPPRALPFTVVLPRYYGNNLWHVLQFLDEDTLIYTGAPLDIWKFDLRTNQSELLFRYTPPKPEESPPPLPVSAGLAAPPFRETPYDIIYELKFRDNWIPVISFTTRPISLTPPSAASATSAPVQSRAK